MVKKIITIALGLPDSNAGGAALGITTINLIRTKFPEHKIYYLSSHHNKELIEKAYPFIRKYCPDVDIIPFPFKRRQDYSYLKNKLIKKSFQVLWVLESCFSTILLLFPIFGKRNSSLYIIMKSELLIGRGTQVFYDHKTTNLGAMIKSFILKYNLCFPFLFAHRAGIPYKIYPQSFGPIHLKCNKMLIAFVIKHAQIVMCREQESVNYLRKLLHKQIMNLKVVPDTVFSMNYDFKAEEEILKDYPWINKTKYCILLIRELIGEFKDSDKIDYFYSNLVQELIENDIVEKVIIITQSNKFKGYDYFENDIKPSQRLYKKLSVITDKIELIDRTFSPYELKVFYSFARYVFTVRLHSAILSITTGTPAFAISYFGTKTTGIFNMLGFEKYLLTPENLTSMKVIDTVKNIEKNYTEEKSKILEVTNNISQLIHENI